VKDPAVIVTASKACARVSACSPRFKGPSACVEWWMLGGSEPLKKCLDAANGCEAVATCLHGGGDAKAAAFCGQRGVVSGCDGSRLVSCSDDDAHEATVVDCAEMGATCADIKSAGGLVMRACSAPAKCPAGSPDVRCEGANTVISCRDGAYERVVCPAGTKCEEHRDEAGDAAASCVVPGQRRCIGGLRRCEEDRLIECEHGKTKVTDCIGQGLHCAGVGPRAGCSVPENVECDKEMLPRCDGGNVVFCAAGRLEKIPCASLGLGPCDPAAKGAFAACSPAAPAKK
jgi:hypothetical protein